jgi:hypothetical protein
MIQTAALMPIVFLLILVLLIYAFVTLRRVLTRLKAEHHGLWVSLGSPKALSSLVASRSADRDANLAGRTTLNLWLSQGGYLELNDPIITSLARRLKIAYVAVVIVGVVFFTYAWFHRYH